MRIRLGLLIFLAFAAGAAIASPFGEAADRLNGEWRGADFVLKVDSRRAQASLDLKRPFHWERFLIKEVANDEVVFTVGAELFEATIDANILVLTGTSFRGQRLLFRDTGLRGAADD